MTLPMSAHLPGCDEPADVFYDIDVLIPVKVRYWATSARVALQQWKDTELQLVGPMHSFSIGFPEALSIKEVVHEVSG